MSGLYSQRGQPVFFSGGQLGGVTEDKARAAQILKAWSEYQISTLGALARWSNALATRHQIGLANCDDLVAYNQAAIGNYGAQMTVIAKLRAGGVPASVFPDPPVPPLFGTVATVNAQPGSIFPKFEFALDCEPASNMARPTVSLHANLCPVSQVNAPDATPLKGVLGFAPAAFVETCAFAGVWCLVAGGIAVGTIFLIMDKTPGVVRSILNSSDEINRLMQDTTARREAQRAEAINACLAKNLPAIVALPPAERAAKAASITSACAAIFPPPKPPPFAKSVFLTVIPLVLVVGGLGVTYWVTRGWAERQRLPRARAA